MIAEPAKPSVTISATSVKEVPIAISSSAVIVEASTENVPTTTPRQPKLIIEESFPFIESSEYEPQIATAVGQSSTTVRTNSLELEFVNLASDIVQDQSVEGSSFSSVYELPNNHEALLASLVTPEVQVSCGQMS